MGTPIEWHNMPQTITYSESRLLIDLWREHFHQKLLQLSYWPLAWALLFFILFHCKVERLRDFQINLSDWECRFPEICPNLHTPEVKNLCQFNHIQDSLASTAPSQELKRWLALEISNLRRFGSKYFVVLSLAQVLSWIKNVSLLQNVQEIPALENVGNGSCRL